MTAPFVSERTAVRPLHHSADAERSPSPWRGRNKRRPTHTATPHSFRGPRLHGGAGVSRPARSPGMTPDRASPKPSQRLNPPPPGGGGPFGASRMVEGAVSDALHNGGCRRPPPPSPLRGATSPWRGRTGHRPHAPSPGLGPGSTFPRGDGKSLRLHPQPPDGLRHASAVTRGGKAAPPTTQPLPTAAFVPKAQACSISTPISPASACRPA